VTVSNQWSSVTSSNAVLTVTADTTPAQAVLVASYDPGWIVASFDEELDPVSVADTNHYIVSGGAFVTGAYLRSDGKSVLLRVGGSLETNFTLAVSNVLDRALGHNSSSLVVTGSVMGLTGADIGNAGDPLEPGSTRTLPDGTIEVIAGGSDIWNRTDGFHYSYQPRVGDFDVRVQVSRLDATNAWSKAGLMVRDSLAPTSRNLTAVVTPAGPTADSSQGADTYMASWRVAPNAPTTEWDGTGSSAGVPYPNAWIRLRREGNTFTAYRGTNGIDWTLFARMNLDILESPLPETVFLGLATTSHNNNSNQTTTAHYQNFSRVNLPPTFNTLAGADIGQAGDPLEAGSTVFHADGSIEVVAGGTDIWNSTDGFHFTCQRLTGDFDAQVQVAQLNPINRWSKAGLMVRESLNPGSRDLVACVTPSGPTTDGDTGADVYQLLHRSTTDGDTVGLAESSGVPYPNAWIRLCRQGNTFTAYRGTDASHWTQYAQTTLATPFADTIYFGLATTAHNNNSGKTTTALYRNYSVSPPPPGDLRIQTVNEGDLLAVSAAADDPDLPAETLTYGLDVGAPAGAAIDSASGLFTWTPSEAQGPSTNTITVRVFDDGVPSLSATQSFTVVVREVNSAPGLTVPVDQTLDELTTLTVTNTATDADLPANVLTFELLAGPTGVSLNPATGLLTWTPTEAQGPSTNTITVRVFDDGVPSLSSTNSFTVVVREVNTAPMLAAVSAQSVNEGTTLSVTNVATDADLPANVLTFELVAGPTGVSLNPATGVLTWTPTEAQGPSTNTITVRVFDDGVPSLSCTNSFIVTVNEINRPPQLSAIDNYTVRPGQTISFFATATDPDIPTNSLTFALTDSPGNSTIDANSGLFRWRPSVAQADTTNILQVRVTDNSPTAISAQALSDTQLFTVIVEPLEPVVLTPFVGTGNQFQIRVEGPVGPDYLLEASSTLTGWLTVQSNSPAAMPFHFSETNAAGFDRQFYRVRLWP
jgi:hypothetical protein